jgi:hypothetical protein
MVYVRSKNLQIIWVLFGGPRIGKHLLIHFMFTWNINGDLVNLWLFGILTDIWSISNAICLIFPVLLWCNLATLALHRVPCDPEFPHQDV